VGAGRITIGVTGIDTILNGGLFTGRAYLVRGGPGSGKTTLGLHFLTAGSDRGLFVSLGERSNQIEDDARAQGFDITRLSFLDLSPTAEDLAETEPYDLFSAADVEQQPLVDRIVRAVDERRPARVFIDSLTQLRYLAHDAFQFRKQVLALLRYLTAQGATVLFSAEGAAEVPDDDLQFLSDGILHLEATGERRTFRVTKFRGDDFSEGPHSLRLDREGMTVYPRLVPSEHGRSYGLEAIGFGVPEVDTMLHGGLERGTATIVTGPTGVGKTTLGVRFMREAASRGERSVIYTFEENLNTLRHRCEHIQVPLERMIDEGTLAVVDIEPLRYTPDEFAAHVRYEVEERGTRVVMLDSLAGYKLSVGGESVVRRLHALSRYLVNMGVTVLIINEIETIAGGEFRATEVGISYLADAVILLRYVEMQGELRKCIGILKKRTSDFEKNLREFEITAEGIRVGPPMNRMRGILRGDPDFLPEPADRHGG
jgi:circadian clock protein KaiC